MLPEELKELLEMWQASHVCSSRWRGLWWRAVIRGTAVYTDWNLRVFSEVPPERRVMAVLQRCCFQVEKVEQRSDVTSTGSRL